ncbi:sugar phosphate isomerase/epimerase [soil metagenome]
MTFQPRLAIHTITNRPWSPGECIKNYAAAGVAGITFWRRDFERTHPGELARQCADFGLEVVSLARGGFFPASDAAARQAAVEDNLRAIDEAEAVCAPSLVLVCGADPAQPLADSRSQIRDGIAACLGHAAAAGVVLAIEPLHPMYADTRSAVNTMAQANDLCEALGSPGHLGIACDVYHTWWDPALEPEIARAAGRGNLTSFHICDWNVPTTDLLNDRAIPGDGCIGIAEISSWIDAAGFAGHREVEIFSDHHWARDQGEYLNDIIAAYVALYPHA